jgi:hypothetical protein
LEQLFADLPVEEEIEYSSEQERDSKADSRHCSYWTPRSRGRMNQFEHTLSRIPRETIRPPPSTEVHHEECCKTRVSPLGWEICPLDVPFHSSPPKLSIVGEVSPFLAKAQSGIEIVAWCIEDEPKVLVGKPLQRAIVAVVCHQGFGFAVLRGVQQ